MSEILDMPKTEQGKESKKARKERQGYVHETLASPALHMDAMDSAERKRSTKIEPKMCHK